MTMKTTRLNSRADSAFTGFMPETLAFFAAVKFNNNREFFNDNREMFERAVKKPLIALAEEIAPAALEVDPAFDPRPARAVSRIWRDVRFRRDKSPLRDYMWIGFRRQGEQRGESCGFYFDISAEGANWGCGYYQMQPEAMANLRRMIVEKPEKVRKILHAPGFAGQFELLGESYQRQYRPPEGMDDELGALYTKKNVYCEHHVADIDELMQPELAGRICEGFRAMKDFYYLLRECAQTVNQSS